MLELLLVLWLIYIPSALNMFYRIIKNWRQYEKKVDYNRKFNSPTVHFLITTKNCPSVVQQTVDSIVDSCSKINYKQYKIQIATDAILHQCANADTVVIPTDFKTVATYKARAMQYMLTLIPNDSNTWIFHLDEESAVTEQCVRAVLEYIEDGGKPIAEGPINYPNDIRNVLTLFAEGERSTSCFYCVDQMQDSPVWLHGSNLLVNSVIEHAVGWEFGKSLAEDQRFAYEAEKKFGKVFGWHGGIVLEKPAFSIKDAIKQRKRWFRGSMQNLCYLNSKRKILQYYFLASWLVGFFAAAMSPITWLNVIPTALPIKIALTVAMVCWFAQYQIGLYLNVRHVTTMSRARKLWLHTLQFVLCPVVGIVSTFPAVLAVIQPPKTFEVVQK